MDFPIKALGVVPSIFAGRMEIAGAPMRFFRELRTRGNGSGGLRRGGDMGAGTLPQGWRHALGPGVARDLIS